jgi:hypothetical protein
MSKNIIEGGSAMDRRTVRKKAAARGHTLGRFVTRYFTGQYGYGRRAMYSVAWCQKCEAAAFTRTDSGVNPAMDHDCETPNAALTGGAAVRSKGIVGGPSVEEHEFDDIVHRKGG